jgi:hypothetical protein
MNADGARRVLLDADVAARSAGSWGVGIGRLASGLLLVAGGIVLIVVAARRSSRPANQELHRSCWPCGQRFRPKKRLYAEARQARRGNALLRPTGSTCGAS